MQVPSSLTLLLRQTLAVFLLGALAACGGHSPPGPTPPVVDPITLTCPSDVRMEDVPGTSQNVTFNPPTAIGGAPPLTITCTPASGSSFSIGDTPVACSATDGVRNGVCSFRVTLIARIPVISVTKFLAFGDSITLGENGVVLRDPEVLVVDTPNSYPVILNSLLEQRYITQSFSVTVSAVRSETAVEGASRISSALGSNPNVLLLLEGVNDCVNGAPCNPGVIADALRNDIVQARGRGIAAFVSTLLPIDGTAPRGRTYQWPLISRVNDAIRPMVAAEGATLVDNWMAFQGHATAGDYLADDGLHPSPAGNRAIAQAFLDAIQAKFEASPAGIARRRFPR